MGTHSVSVFYFVLSMITFLIFSQNSQNLEKSSNKPNGAKAETLWEFNKTFSADTSIELELDHKQKASGVPISQLSLCESSD